VNNKQYAMPPTPTDRFLAAFNRIDAAMRKMTGVDNKTTSFVAVANKFSQSYVFPHQDFIRVVAELRNVLVHEKKDAVEELAIPAEHIVSKLERIAGELEAPERVETRIALEKVSTVTADDSLKHVLILIKEKQFSQFPVIQDGKIIGLLTENGIARWLSAEVASESLIEFADATVAKVLAHEEERPNMALVSRYAYVGQVRMQFSQNALLEAVIITQAGKADQTPLGILTRWDFI
jgi:predicted transcriptional regulator